MSLDHDVEHALVSARFAALFRHAADDDWKDVLLRAGLLKADARKRSLRMFLLVGIVVAIGGLAFALFDSHLHGATAAPPGPSRVDRKVRNGTIHWLFSHQTRGQSLREADIPLLATVGAHWQRVRFARVITPDPTGGIRVVLSLIGPRGRNLCMTVLEGSSINGGCAVARRLKPFNYDISSHVDPACATCVSIVIAGVASDDVARMRLFLPGGRKQDVELRDNVFVARVPPTTSSSNLVAYDRNGLVIGRSVQAASIGALQ